MIFWIIFLTLPETLLLLWVTSLPSIQVKCLKSERCFFFLLCWEHEQILIKMKWNIFQRNTNTPCIVFKWHHFWHTYISFAKTLTNRNMEICFFSISRLCTNILWSNENQRTQDTYVDCLFIGIYRLLHSKKETFKLNTKSNIVFKLGNLSLTKSKRSMKKKLFDLKRLFRFFEL